MENRFSYALVGTFVIAALIILMMVSVWLATGREKVNYLQYQVVTDESVAGLSINSQIDYRGVNIGKVTNIALDKNDPAYVTISLDIDENAPIKQDTKAVLMGKGITGLVSVSLTGGSAESPPLLPTKENPIPIIPNGPSLSKRLDEAFENVTVAVSSLTNQLHSILTPENIERFSRVAENIETITSELAEASPAVRLLVDDTTNLVNEVRPKIAAAADSLSDVREIIESWKEASHNIERNINEFVTSLSSIPDNVNGAIISWQNVAYTTDSHLRTVLPQFRETLEDISRLVDQLNENPSTLLLGNPKRPKGPGE